jgi:ABC-type bacteriocin/lantibiotic exporter with double-glycine peptidase domain
VLSVLLAAALSFAAVLNAVELYIVEFLGRRVFLRTAKDFSKRLPRVLRSRLDGRDLDELSNRFIDVVVVEKSLAELVFDGTSAVLQIGAALVLLGLYHPFLLAFDLALICAVLVVIYVLGRNAVQTAMNESVGKYALLGWLQDVASNTLAFRSRRGANYVDERTEELAGVWLEARRGHFHIQFRQIIGMLSIQVAATTSLLALGGFLVLDRQLSLGQLVAAEVLITVTVSSLAKVGRLFPKYYDLLAALDKIGAVLDLPVADPEGEHLTPESGGLALQARVPGMDIDLPAGGAQLICASENREALDLVHAFLAPSTHPRGTLRVNEVDALDVDLEEFTEQVLLLRSDGLFPGTIIDNVRFGDESIERSKVRVALDQVGLHDVVERLPDGIYSLLNRNGEPLSLGNQARLLLARALVLKPSLLVVDRVFDSLGVKERARVIDLLFEGDLPWTVLYITAHGGDSRFRRTQPTLEEVVA